MYDLFAKLGGLLDKRERWLALLLLLFTFVVSLIEVFGVASIMPFMAVLANPEVIKTNKILSFTYDFFNFESTDNFLFFLGITVLVFLVGSALLRAFVFWLQVYYSNLRNFTISSRLVHGYLNKPYVWYLNHNSSEFAASIIEEVSRVVHLVLYPVLRLITSGIIAAMLIILFLLVDPTLAIGISIFLGLTYGLIFKLASTRLSESGKQVSKYQQKRIKVFQEAFGGIKDVKIKSLENAFSVKFRKSARRLALNIVSLRLWAEIPNFGIQAIVFGGMMIVILYLMRTRVALEDTIPVLALYALGGYKLMPSLQEMYRQLAQIKGNRSALDNVYNDINMLEKTISNGLSIVKNQIKFQNILELRNIQYNYPGADKAALTDINLKIEKNSTVGFVGSSGSGKTTAVDIILGLLEPDKGGVYVDSIKIEDSYLFAWRKNIGYVPQQIFLTDDSIAANIAFGIPHDDIDLDAVKKAAEMANLHDFIIGELPRGYETQVGEHGIRLSGGQRQRIGIARALYNNPEILIFDEATSALDNLTEKAVMDAVNQLGNTKTIIMIAHRLSTVQSCDKIFLFEKGKIIAEGDYNDLIINSQEFRDMAHAND